MVVSRRWARDRVAGTDGWRVAALVLLVATISTLHYVTSPTRVVWHEVFQRLYYVPIILAAYWYGVRGGLLTALLVSLAYLPHIRMAWTQGVQQEASRYAELVVFNLVGVVVGLLAGAQRRVTERYQRAAASLEAANRELRDAYDHLRRADRLKALGEIAAGLAHEIRHPLASIGGALEIIESRAAEDSPEGEFSRLAKAELQRLDRLVMEFLRYARPHEPELRQVPLGDVVDRVAALVQVEADRRAVTLEVERPGALPLACVDPQQIEQVLLNVVLNAIQASPSGGRVIVRESIDEPDMLIDVIDEGPGVPDVHMARIFSPFFTTKEKGTGLGLAIAHRIVTAHAGSIATVDGGAKGGGWFRVR
ncbi:MAG: sensor histidine kinase, partial [Vicinamibacteria bacterium]|nr:sensor histidine kinase [Vicinamibacteria bacterium]